MNKKYTNILWGLCLIVLGVIMLGNYMNLFSIDVFFDGWWTLFIIIPSIVEIFIKNNNRTSNVIFLIIGVLFLLSEQNIIDKDMLWKLALPSVIIVIGLSIIISQLKNKKVDANIPIDCNKTKDQVYTAIFSGNERRYSNEEFNGACLTAIFGGVDLDIRDAIINKDVVINAVSISGVCNILAPKNVSIKTTGINIFGGTNNKAGGPVDNCHTIYVKTVSIFGGVDIK